MTDGLGTGDGCFGFDFWDFWDVRRYWGGDLIGWGVLMVVGGADYQSSAA